MIPAVTALPFDPIQTPEVVRAVLQDPFVVSAPLLLPVAKVALIAAAILPFIGVRWSGRILLGYYAAILVIVAFLQNMANTEQFGYAWLVGNTVVQVIVAAWCLIDVATGRTILDRAGLRTGRLWLLAPMALALLMPYRIEGGNVAPSIESAPWNEAGVSYCMITPVVLGVLLIFSGGVDRRTLSVASFVGLGFGVMNLVVWFGLNPENWWMGVLHFPLVIISALGLVESRLPRHR
ncbi:MAG: hypothetical protein AMXMBFR34_47630 [Myxococcaceae bacterium]